MLKIFRLPALVLSCAFFAFGFAAECHAKEITIVYTGDTHAMLYPCNCPVEPDGGVSRRGAFIKELRKAGHNVLVLDSGSFFAGGIADPDTQNAQLDTQRTLVNLKAMEIMRYDAAAVGADEFNFGKGLLEQSAGSAKFPFLSCNISLNNVVPFVIKDVAGSKVGIIGVTAVAAAQKTGGLAIKDAKAAVKESIAQLRQKNPDIIVLLSGLEDEENLELLKELPEINIVISGHSSVHKEKLTKAGAALLLRPAWQGRRLGKITLSVADRKIANYKFEDLRLSDKIKDDPDILKVLPQCFSDSQCRKEGMVGNCKNAGMPDAGCQFSRPPKVELIVVAPKECRVCNTEPMVNHLKGRFPGLAVSYLYYPSASADKLIKDTGTRVLPIYLLSKAIEKEAGFNEQFRKAVEEKAGFYMLRAAYSGISYLLGRQKAGGKLDLLLSLYDKNAAATLEAIRSFNPEVHFLAAEKDGSFETLKGRQETEECLRSVCVKKYYPGYFYDYILCRAKNSDSSWWEDCALKLDAARITACAKGKEGLELLKENTAFNREIDVMFGPTYVMDDVEVFATEGTPTKEELGKVIKK